MAKPVNNIFFDINKFPSDFGITILGVSMPHITTVQKPEACFTADLYQIPKIQISGVGAHIVYSDGLYMYSDESAVSLKTKFQKLIEDHKEGYQNQIKKNPTVIPSSYTFTTWSQLILECKNFSRYLKKIEKFYVSDLKFQEYVKADIEKAGKKVSPNTIAYILEEILLDFLVVKGKVRLQNDYIGGKEKWILNCYHGKPHRAHIYFHQTNPLSINNSQNLYQDSWYDVLSNKLYEFHRLDIDSFDFS